MSHERIEYINGYESWDDFVDRSINTDKDNLNPSDQSAFYIELEQLKKKPPLGDFLEHQKFQHELATIEGRGNDAHWKTLKATITSVEEALIDDCNSEIAMRSIALGCAIEALQQPSNRILTKMIKAYISKSRSERPLKDKNNRLAVLKCHAQSLAETLWYEDVNKELRITGMCHEIWPELVEISDVLNFRDVLPDRAELLKNWIRPVAPDWAKKGGAPKK